MPDIRLRFLLTRDNAPQGAPDTGIQIRDSLIKPFIGDNEAEYYVERPEINDWLISIGGEPTPSFTHYLHALSKLRSLQVSAQLPLNSDPSEEDVSGSLGHLIEIVDNGRAEKRLVRISFWRPGWPEPHETWVVLTPLPVIPLVIATVWLLLHLGIIVVSAIAYWSRPFDRTARLFFYLSLTTANSFIGGFVWWVVASNYFLLSVFMLNAILLPAITLHFFLVFPTPLPTINKVKTPLFLLIYGIPAYFFLHLSYDIFTCYLISKSPSPYIGLNFHLENIKWYISIYVTCSFLFFFAGIISLHTSLGRTRNLLERKQVIWILRAAWCSFPFVLYSIYLSFFHRVEFAFGKAAFPMFAVSTLFLAAYSIGFVRFRLLMLDQLLNRNVLAYFVEYALALFVSLGIACVCLFGVLSGEMAPEKVFAFSIFLVVVNLTMLWLRDQLQRKIERQFSHEKYPVSKTLQQFQIPSNETLKANVVADRMLTACKEGLKVDQGSLYLHSDVEKEFQLVTSFGEGKFLLTHVPSKEFLDSLRHNTALQRISPRTHSTLTTVQVALRELDGWLVHGLELNHKIIGFVVLGQKQQGEPFTPDDVAYLNSLCHVTSIAIHCATIQQQVSHLYHEVDRKEQRIEEQRRLLSLLQDQKTISIESTANETQVSISRNGIIGNSPAIQQIFSHVQKISASDVSVLIRGESGTGKELFAKAIHQNSTRAKGPLVSVHCAALSPSLLESELFGHVKGAFTGADQERIGRFSLAHGGTLFLDEIGDISAEIQVKLLRVLQERCFEPVGSGKTVHVDVRLVAATHQNLEQLIKKGQFREDLFYRLNVISLELPSLRERRDDILPLTGYFLNRACERTGNQMKVLSPEVLCAMENYNWPGNIRELENCVERAVVLADGKYIHISHMPPELKAFHEKTPMHSASYNRIENSKDWQELYSDSSHEIPEDDCTYNAPQYNQK